MLERYEAALFYHLAKEWFTGRGTIIDAGSFLGKSAFFFAEGLRQNADPAAVGQRIHCFDIFRANEFMTVEFVREHAHQEVPLGGSTRGIFEDQVASVRDLLEVHEGDFHHVPWQHQPIEILMIDIAKTQSLGQRVVSAFFPDLIPDVSIVVHQDYHHPWLPHIHVVMEFLADYFELVVPRADDSAAFLYKKAIPAAMLERAAAYRFTVGEEVQLMDRALQRMPAAERHYLELTRLVLQLRILEPAQAALRLQKIERDYAACRADPAWARYFDSLRNHIDTVDGWRQLERRDYRRALELADGLIARGQVDTFPLSMRGCCLRALGRREEAEQTLRQATSLRPRSGFACIELAALLLDQGRFDEAETLLVTAAHDPDAVGANAEHYCGALLDAWRRRGQREHAVAALARLEASAASQPEFWVLKAQVAMQHGDRGTSIASLRRARELGLSDARLAQLRHHLPDDSLPADAQ